MVVVAGAVSNRAGPERYVTIIENNGACFLNDLKDTVTKETVAIFVRHQNIWDI